MTKKYLADPFNALYLYQDDSCLSERPEIQELDQYARDLEDKIEGDFNLDYITFEFAYNRLAYVRNGLLLAKLKFLKLYKNFGDGTFATFCREQLKITRWQVNDNIKAARVCMELIYAGFEILPTNISQAIALSSLVGDELVHAWRSVIESIEPDKITHKSIRSLLFPPTLEDLPTTTIKVPPTLHENIHAEAAERGMSIVEFIKTMFEFFISSGTTPILQGDVGSPNVGVNSHLLKDDVDSVDYALKERIWREDLATLAAENGAI
ncbi:MAG: hypothetical protein AAF383_24850 [Cyanobacteria bacterium P01_A01_bin.83]